MQVILIAIFGYLVGSISFGYLFSKYVGKVDIRKIGSGNIGATNVGRAMGKKWGIIIFLLDGLKGVFVYSIALNVSNKSIALLAVLTCVVGHIYPIFLKFKGGKGISTTALSFLAIDYRIFLIFAIFWIGVFFATKYVSLASICAVVGSFLGSILITIKEGANPTSSLTIGIIAVLTVYKHSENINRLINGTEYSFKNKK